MLFLPLLMVLAFDVVAKLCVGRQEVAAGLAA
jgi:hypothetical protein